MFIEVEDKIRGDEKMSLQRTPVRIKLDTFIRDDQVMDRITNSFQGTFIEKDHTAVLMYREQLDDGHYVDTFITITDQKVNVKRSGAVSMNQAFIDNERTECVYTHPHGTMHMETFTKERVYERTAIGGKISLRYEVKLNGQDARHHEFELTYTKEDK